MLKKPFFLGGGGGGGGAHPNRPFRTGRVKIFVIASAVK